VNGLAKSLKKWLRKHLINYEKTFRDRGSRIL